MKSISTKINKQTRFFALYDSTNESNDTYRTRLSKLLGEGLDNYGESETYIFVRTDTDGVIGLVRFVLNASRYAAFRDQFGADWDKPVGWGADIWLDPNFRGYGLSKHLIRVIEETAYEKGMGYMAVKVWKSSKNYTWYARAGYDDIRDGQDATLFVKILGHQA